MIRIFLILVLFSSCTKTIYSRRFDDSHTEDLILLWKKSGQYNGLFAANKKNQYNWTGIIIQKANCDSFRIDRWEKTIGSKKSNIKFYIVSRNGINPAEFTNDEINLIAELKRTADSLNWCHQSILCCPDSLYMKEIPRNKKKIYKN
jgi:hypothetical protein